MPTLSLAELRRKYGDADGAVVHDPEFSKIADRVFAGGRRAAPFAGVSTLLDAPFRAIDWSKPDFSGLATNDSKLPAIQILLASKCRP